MTLADLGIELLNPALRCGGFRAVLFDFDGTLSLLREGWPQVMSDLMIEALRQTPAAESEAERRVVADDLVARFNGQPTILQMERLGDEVSRRGGTPLPAREYKQHYLDRLNRLLAERLKALRSAATAPDTWLVPGSLSLLAALQRRGVVLCLASGTDWINVQEEARLLGLTPFFGDRIGAPRSDALPFSKRQVIADLLADLRLDGAGLLGIGDGPIETQEVKRVGGTTIGVVYDKDRPGRPSEWRRHQLLHGGADALLVDYRQAEPVVEWLMNPSVAVT